MSDKPVYAVIFTSTLKPSAESYDAMAEEMAALSKQQPGFLGLDSVRNPSGEGITVCYWDSLEAIANWKENARHRHARQRGRDEWYESYSLKICRVERDERFTPSAR